jgi:anthranilate 1,2-dioxygenase small subunit
MIDLARRVAVQDLVARYGGLLDREDYQGWLDLFDAGASYRIAPRENIDQGLPASLMLCETKKALTDRIVAMLKANKYRPVIARHLVGTPELIATADGGVRVRAAYSLYHVDGDGHAELYSIGGYDFRLVFANERAAIREAVVIVDSFLIPTLLVKPI